MVHASPRRQRVDTRQRSPLLLGTVALIVTLVSHLSAQARALPQEGPSRITILIGDSADAAKAKEITESEQNITIAIRPNQVLTKHLFVKNVSDDAEKNYRIELRGGAPGSEKLLAVLDSLKVARGQASKLSFPKAAVAPPPNSPGEEVTGTIYPLKLSVLDLNPLKKGVRRDFTINVDTLLPTSYIESPKPILERMTPGTPDRIVTAKLKANPARFVGAECPVEFKVDEDLMPGLKPPAEGNLKGVVSKEKSYSVKARLPFAVAPAKGQFSFTVDNYPRAFVYQGSFAKDAAEELKEYADRVPRVRILTKNISRDKLFVEPQDFLDVKVEADNAEPDERMELSFSPTGNDDDWTTVAKLGGDRDRRIRVEPAGPEGAIALYSEVKDWVVQVPVSGVTGGVIKLRLRLLSRDRFFESGAVGTDPDTWARTKLETTVIFDRTPPIGIFVDLPKTKTRGKTLNLKSKVDDVESDVAGVLYFLGEPEVDPKTGAQKLPAGLKPKDKINAEKDGEFWQAEVRLPDEKKKVSVTAQFTNRAGLVAYETKEIELIDPESKADGKAKTGSIKGIVLEGDRDQGGLNVVLIDVKGAQVGDLATTDKDGIFEFKDVAPGIYRLGVHKQASRTDARATVKVEAGKTTEANLELRRMSRK